MIDSVIAVDQPAYVADALKRILFGSLDSKLPSSSTETRRLGFARKAS